MKAYIFLHREGAGARVYKTYYERTRAPEDVIICANGGYKTARSFSIEPHIVVGDLDSLSAEKIGEGIEVKSYPPEKDYSDYELALGEAVRLRVEEVVVFGALGGRKDHEIVNLVVTAHAGIPVVLIEEEAEIHNVIKSLEIAGKKGSVCSLVAFCGGCRVRKMEGFRYSLTDEEIIPSSRGLSNVIERDKASITLADGSLFLIIPAGAHHTPRRRV
ncbi:MAG: thiamine diphosphokinase [Spirochaetes bacterium]|nr:thiamine diphosphokinase [Spirochaetota bacterium]